MTAKTITQPHFPATGIIAVRYKLELIDISKDATFAFFNCDITTKLTSNLDSSLPALFSFTMGGPGSGGYKNAPGDVDTHAAWEIIAVDDDTQHVSASAMIIRSR